MKKIRRDSSKLKRGHFILMTSFFGLIFTFKRYLLLTNCVNFHRLLLNNYEFRYLRREKMPIFI